MDLTTICMISSALLLGIAVLERLSSERIPPQQLETAAEKPDVSAAVVPARARY